MWLGLVRREPRPGRWSALFCFLVPWILALLAWGALGAFVGGMKNSQMTWWLQKLFPAGLGAALHRYGETAYSFWGFVCQEVGWVGLAFLVLGIWALRRRPR